MNTSRYIPHFAYGDRVRFMGYSPHPHMGEQCKIILVLPNPSMRPEHQWYDVQFDDLSIGRFLERYIVRLNSDRKDISREIPPDEWAQFFETFSGQHENWIVRVETFNRDNAEQLASETLRLKSISVDQTDPAKKMIVFIGEGETTELSHLIRKPSRVLMTQTETGADEGVEIDSENGLVVIRFRCAVLPELVDGVVA
jgi:hypothetical protein